jgi:peptidoglycan hydrolase CwlO-like protein
MLKKIFYWLAIPVVAILMYLGFTKARELLDKMEGILAEIDKRKKDLDEREKKLEDAKKKMEDIDKEVDKQIFSEEDN